MKLDERENIVLKRLDDEIGFGCFHLSILLLGSCITLCVNSAVISISLVMPVIGSDLELSTSRKGGIEACLFVGMLFGTVLFGWLSDAYGRRTALLLALPVTGTSLFFSAFSFHWVFFLVTVFFVGFGTGGTIAPILTYVAECSVERFRGPLLLIVQTGQDLGIACTTFLAWWLMGSNSEVSQMSLPLGSLRFVAWRLYLILCAFFVLLMVLPLMCSPESPLFLLHKGRNEKLQKLLLRMKAMNSCGCWRCGLSGGKVKKSLSNVELLKEGPQTTDGPQTSDAPPAGMQEPKDAGQQEGKGVVTHTRSEQGDSHEGRDSPQEKLELVGGDQDDTSGQPKQYSERDVITEHFCIHSCCRVVVDMLHKLVELVSSFYCTPHVYKTIIFHVIFFTTLFGYYGAKLWYPEIFKRIPLYKDVHPFQIKPITPSHNQSGFQVPYVYYQDALFIALSAIPSSIVAVVMFKTLGAKLLLVGSGLVATSAGIYMWFAPMEHDTVLVLSCVYNAGITLALSSLKIGAANIYPTSIRSTALGLHNGVGRLGAIAANVVFGELVDTSVALPMLLSAGMVLLGTGVALFTPSMYKKRDEPMLYKCISKVACTKAK